MRHSYRLHPHPRDHLSDINVARFFMDQWAQESELPVVSCLQWIHFVRTCVCDKAENPLIASFIGMLALVEDEPDAYRIWYGRELSGDSLTAYGAIASLDARQLQQYSYRLVLKAAMDFRCVRSFSVTSPTLI